MPFESAGNGRKSIAVIGAGISGMGAAWLLSADHDVTLFEAEDRLGGHARTKFAGPNKVAVDTGFIVFNYANYPRLAEMFGALDVPVAKSNMSFGASIGGGRLEYGLASLDALFAQRRNLFDVRYLRMIRDILRFNKTGLDVARANPELTIGEFLRVLGTGPWFRDHYLLPFSGAIWSTPTEQIMDFPAHAMMQFFENHALLSHAGQHQWYTVQGGSIEYVRRLEVAMLAQGVDIRLKAPVQAVTRLPGGVRVKTWGADWQNFDEVIFATHSDDTLAMLHDARPEEQAVLGAVAYQPNDIVLHSDERVMPKRRKTWSSWVYTEDAASRSDRIDLTYWMNSLQPLPANENFFVTLNSRRNIREDLIWDQVTLRHPVYDLPALAAQKAAAAMNGRDNTWFCGAWMKNGFHEDGLSSAHDVADAIIGAPAARIAAE
ncbi:MAG: FAD-dependent oxidoreductase [Pseudomonadota bacterium]